MAHHFRTGGASRLQQVLPTVRMLLAVSILVYVVQPCAAAIANPSSCRDARDNQKQHTDGVYALDLVVDSITVTKATELGDGNYIVQWKLNWTGLRCLKCVAFR